MRTTVDNLGNPNNSGSFIDGVSDGPVFPTFGVNMPFPPSSYYLLLDPSHISIFITYNTQFDALTVTPKRSIPKNDAQISSASTLDDEASSKGCDTEVTTPLLKENIVAIKSTYSPILAIITRLYAHIITCLYAHIISLTAKNSYDMFRRIDT